MAADVFAFIHLASGQGGSGLSPHVAAGFALPLPFGAGPVEATAVADADAVADAESEGAADADADADAEGAALAEAAAEGTGADAGAGGGSSLEQATRAAIATAARSVRVMDPTIVARRVRVLWLVATCGPWSS
jgi:hypothetical protein